MSIVWSSAKKRWKIEHECGPDYTIVAEIVPYPCPLVLPVEETIVVYPRRVARLVVLLQSLEQGGENFVSATMPTSSAPPPALEDWASQKSGNWKSHVQQWEKQLTERLKTLEAGREALRRREELYAEMDELNAAVMYLEEQKDTLDEENVGLEHELESARGELEHERQLAARRVVAERLLSSRFHT